MTKDDIRERPMAAPVPISVQMPVDAFGERGHGGGATRTKPFVGMLGGYSRPG